MRRWFDTTLIFLVTCAFGLSLAQRTMYGVDGWVLLRRIVGGDLRSDMHLAFKPVAYVGLRVGQGLGLTAHDAVVATCAVCTALGVAGIHRAALALGAGRGAAALLALCVAATPGVAFFATVVERHGVFMAGVGIAAWAAAALAARPSPLRAVVLGLAIAIAYALHSTGVVLWLAFVPMAFLAVREAGFARQSTWRRDALLAATAGVAAVVLILLFRQAALAIGTMRDPGASFAFFLAHARVHGRQPGMLVASTWNEIVAPLLPFSITCWFAWWRPSLRLTASAILLASLAYAVLVWLMLGDFDERGAYTLPLAWPFAWLTWRAVGVRGTLVALLAAGTLAVIGIRRHDDRHLAPVAEGMTAIAGSAPLFLLPAAPSDFELIYLHFPRLRGNLDVWDLFDAAHFPPDAIESNTGLLVDSYLKGKLDEGRVVLISEAGWQWLAEPTGDASAGPTLRAILERSFQLEPVGSLGFRGLRVQRRP
ncbi:MAG: hypothetical protein AB7I19_02320 [Planctomycetota bacterium]